MMLVVWSSSTHSGAGPRSDVDQVHQRARGSELSHVASGVLQRMLRNGEEHMDASVC